MKRGGSGVDRAAPLRAPRELAGGGVRGREGVYYSTKMTLSDSRRLSNQLQRQVRIVRQLGVLDHAATNCQDGQGHAEHGEVHFWILLFIRHFRLLPVPKEQFE